MTPLSGFDAWLSREPSIFIDPHAPWSAWRTEGMYEPEVVAQVVCGDPEDESAVCIDMPNFETAEAWAWTLNAWHPAKHHTYDPESDDSTCSICGELSPATEARWMREEEEARNYG